MSKKADLLIVFLAHFLRHQLVVFHIVVNLVAQRHNKAVNTDLARDLKGASDFAHATMFLRFDGAQVSKPVSFTFHVQNQQLPDMKSALQLDDKFQNSSGKSK